MSEFFQSDVQVAYGFSGGSLKGGEVNDASAFAAWSNFYVMMGTAAASLTGLMFVVVTLSLRGRVAEEGISAYSTPTVVHFSAALFVAAILTTPWHASSGAILIISGLCGLTYVARIILRTGRHIIYHPDLEDRVWYHALPLAAYVVITAGGALQLSHAADAAQNACAIALLLLIFVGIHNAWDLVTYIALHGAEVSARAAEPGEAEEPGKDEEP